MWKKNTKLLGLSIEQLDLIDHLKDFYPSVAEAIKIGGGTLPTITYSI